MNITLSSGKEVYAEAGVVGICEDLDVSYGLTGLLPEASISSPSRLWSPAEQRDWAQSHLSTSEMLELADIMIARWQKYKDRAVKFGLTYQNQ